MLHKIRLTGLEVFAHHGVLDFEREQGQKFFIDATLWVELDANLGDDISKTVNYGTLADARPELYWTHPASGNSVSRK